MAGNCPSINFGIPTGGATEYDLNSGRELFRCGSGCVKMFITNVSLEKRTVTMSCGSIADGAIDGEICLQSAQISARGQGVVNWVAKENVTSGLTVGSVLTKVDSCGDSDDSSGSIYTHTEGNLSARVIANIEKINEKKDQIRDAVKAKFDPLLPELSGLQWILSDLGVSASPTDWQGGSVTYQGFGVDETHNNKTFRGSFNWQNGRFEIGKGVIHYDTSDDTPIQTVIEALLNA